jgi:large subunit ribosomal protein L6
MSRIGKQPIKISPGTEIKIEGDTIKVKSSKGELSFGLPSEIKAEVKEDNILISPKNKKAEQNESADKKAKEVSALWGLTRALIFNMVKGVTEGFEKKLEIQGVGYKASMQGNKLVMQLGFSHPVELETPEGVELKVEKNIIIVSGIDKQKVGQTAAKIRDFKKPEPYKGKGIRYEGEKVRRKAGKKAVATEK